MKKSRIFVDKLAGNTMLIITILFSSIVILIGVGLYFKSIPILEHNSFWGLLTSKDWYPNRGQFGVLPFIMSTIWVTGISIIIAVPLCVLTSIFLSEYANRKVLNMINPIIDILAGIPSVIFGVWGILIIVPLIRNYLAPFLGISSSGYSILAGGIVLAVMIFPVIIHVLVEVLKTVPVELREASLSLGATKWETIKLVVIRKALPGLIAAIVLGLSRAFGETMAVLMVVGNMIKIPHSVFESGYPLPALIANNYGEMLSIPLYDSALMFSALILFLIVIFFNVLSKLILNRIENKMSL